MAEICTLSALSPGLARHSFHREGESEALFAALEQAWMSDTGFLWLPLKEGPPAT